MQKRPILNNSNANRGRGPKLARTVTKYNPNYAIKNKVDNSLIKIEECTNPTKSQTSDSFSCGSGFNSDEEREA